MTRNQSRNVAYLRPVLTVILISFAFIGAFGVISGDASAAQADEIDITREGSNLTIVISGGNSGDQFTINISDKTGSQVWSVSGELDDSQEQLSYKLTNMSFEENTNLSGSNVEFTLFTSGDGSGQSTERQRMETLDLRAIQFGENPIAVDEQSIIVSITNKTGIPDSEAIPLQIKNQDEAYEFSPKPQDNRLKITLSDVHRNVNILSQINITAFPENEPETKITSDYSVRDNIEDPKITTKDGELQVKYDLIFQGREYTIAVDDQNIESSEGSVKLTASSRGELILENSQVKEEILLRQEADTMLFDDGTELFKEPISTRFNDEEIFELARDVASKKANPDINASDNLRIEDAPLVFLNEQYGVTIETQNPDGIFSATVESDNDGALELPSEYRVPPDAETVNITISKPQTGIIDKIEYDPSLADVKIETGIGEYDGQNLTIDPDGGLSGNIDQAWIQYGDSIILVNSTRIKSNPDTQIADIDIPTELNENASIILFNQEGEIEERLDIRIKKSSFGDKGLFNKFIIILLPLAGLFFAFGVLVSRFKDIPVMSKLPPGVQVLVGHVMFHTVLLLNAMYFVIGTEHLPVTRNSDFGYFFGSGIFIGVFLVIISKILINILNIEEKIEILFIIFVGMVLSGMVTLVAIFSPFEAPELGVGSIYTVFAGGMLIYHEKRAVKSRPSSQRVTNTPIQEVDVTISVRDTVSGEFVDKKVRAKRLSNGITKTSGRRQEQEVQTLSVSGKGTTATLKQGEWKFRLQHRGKPVTETVMINNSRSVEIPLSGVDMPVHVQTTSGKNIRQADITVETRDYNDSGTTNKNGFYQMTLPATAATVDVSAEHELFEHESKSVDISKTSETALTLSPRQGRLIVEAALDRQPVPDVTVTVKRKRQPENMVTKRTNERGAAEFDELLIGPYSLETSLPIDSRSFSISTRDVTVEEGNTHQREVTIQFDYSLSQAQRTQIRDIRKRLQEIAESRRRDDAIQTYYASVLHAVLDEVENIPQAGYAFIQYHHDPDEIVTALLDAIEATAETMDNVLSSRRNVNLFSACSDLPSASVGWSGEADIGALLDIVDQDIAEQRAMINSELEEVDDRISSELRDLSEVSPAREMWEGIRDRLQDQSGLNSDEVAASMFVASLLLDAIKTIFEQQELRKRLEQTVY